MRIAHLRDRLVAADPGLTRLLIALRATAAIAVAFGILTWIARTHHLPLTIPMIGAAIGLTWSIAVNDATPKAQRITVLLLWLPASAALTLGTLTAGNRVLGDVLFLIVVFVSVYVRKYGARGNACGMVAVLGYFFALFLGTKSAQLPWLLLALTITTASTYVSRFLVFVDNPERALHNGMEAFRARQRLIAYTIERAAERGQWTAPLQAELNHHILRLNESALALDDILQDMNRSDLRAAVLDAELQTEEIATRALRDPRVAIDLPQVAIEAKGAAKGWTPRASFRVGTTLSGKGPSPSLRQAIQICTACAASIVVGEFISPQRWYWAVLTAFVVSSGTASAGETIVKAWARVFGTALGVGAGFAVGALVRGHETAAFVALFVCIFFTVYTMRFSYAVMTFFITSCLSLLYVLLGLFSDQTLVLRLIETAIGALFGGLAAIFVVPIRTRDVVGNVAIEALKRLKESVRKASARLSGDSDADPITAIRAFDEALQTMRTQLTALSSAPLARNERTQMRLLLLSACGYYARALARLAYETPGDCDVAEVQRESKAVQNDIDRVIEAFEGKAATYRNGVPAEPASSEALEYLYRIDRTVRRLGEDLAPSSDRG